MVSIISYFVHSALGLERAWLGKSEHGLRLPGCRVSQFLEPKAPYPKKLWLVRPGPKCSVTFDWASARRVVTVPLKFFVDYRNSCSFFN